MSPKMFDQSTDAADSDDMFTDTSMFNAEEIVRQIEMTASQTASAAKKKATLADTSISARRRAEMLREQKRLEAELADLDSMDFDD